MASAKTSAVQGKCPECGSAKWADVLASEKSTFDDPDNGIWGETQHRILRCRGCEQVYHQMETDGSEYMEGPDSKFWPEVPRRLTPDWVSSLWEHDSQLYKIMREVYSSFNGGNRILTSIGIRTAFDRATEALKINPALNFDQKLNELVTLGHIGNAERDMLSILTDAGSAAAHRAWMPTEVMLSTLLDSLEQFLNRVFVQQAAMTAVKGKVPPKPPKPPKQPTPPAGSPKPGGKK